MGEPDWAELKELVSSGQAELLRLTAGDRQEDVALVVIGCRPSTLGKWERHYNSPKREGLASRYLAYLRELKQRYGEVKVATAERKGREAR